MVAYAEGPPRSAAKLKSRGICYSKTFCIAQFSANRLNFLVSGHGAILTKTAARYLFISPRTLDDWRLKGGGPRYMKLGRSVRYSISDLDVYVEGCGRMNTGQSLAG